jgi:NAD(P)-dependent dehydrogenase (short-subunit alcohol dehydrogenase family)
VKLAGKIVLVTGASRGIGAATALELAACGARVIAASRNGAGLDALRRHAQGAAGDLVPAVMDVRDESEVSRTFELVRSRFGTLDALVNNAAVGALGAVESQSVDEWRAVLDTNVLGVLLCCRAAIPLLGAGGTIVNVSSAAANEGFPLLAAYSASKAAVAALSVALRRELKERRIRVSTVRIHYVASEFLSAVPAERIGEATEVWRKQGLLSEVPLMAPARVGETIRFLIELPPEATVHEVDLRATGA